MKKIKFKANLIITALLLLPALLFSQADSLKWENLGMADEQQYASGTQFDSENNHNKVTVTYALPDSGEVVPSYEASTRGGSTGSMEFRVDAVPVNPPDNIWEQKLCVTFTFETAVIGLNFGITDIDIDAISADTTRNWVDAVEITYNGSTTNNLTPSSQYVTSVGASVALDDEPFMTGFEGVGGARNASTDGNLDIDFGATEITDFTICYFSSDGAQSNPTGQSIWLSDLHWTDMLPVELSHFGAKATIAGIMLNWTTESETENLGFVLERRVGEADFVEIASYKTEDALLGQGSVEYATDYEYVDSFVEVGKTYEYRLADVDYHGTATYHAARSVTVTRAPVVGKVEGFTVLDAYPNPFNPSTTIDYVLPQTETNYSTTVEIYDISGKLVKTILNEEQSAGWHSIVWNGTNADGNTVPAGVYLSKVSFGSETKTIKVMFVK